jgi:hypothetical protein
LEPHHAACRERTDDEQQAITGRDVDELRAELLDRMAARNARRLDRIREDEGRLL